MRLMVIDGGRVVGVTGMQDREKKVCCSIPIAGLLDISDLFFCFFCFFFSLRETSSMTDACFTPIVDLAPHAQGTRIHHHVASTTSVLFPHFRRISLCNPVSWDGHVAGAVPIDGCDKKDGIRMTHI